MTNTDKCKTIYILGNSRSGSTILNILLGNIDSVFAAGEINNYLSSGWVNDHFCSCGNPVSKCEFWPQVRARLESTDEIEPESLLHISKRLENWRNLCKSFIKKSDEQRSAEKQYIEFNTRLIKTIATLSHTDWVVDASKSPMRLHHILKADNLGTSVIHIVRDPRGVCWSQMKPAKKNAEAGIQVEIPSTPYLVTIKNLYINALMAFLVKRRIRHKCLTIRYDALVNSTPETLDKISALLKVDTSPLLETVRSGQSLQQYHNVAGNRLRMKSNITLRYDQSWKSSLSNTQFMAITALTLPLLILHRFPLNRKIN